jgi:hypothetical protein
MDERAPVEPASAETEPAEATPAGATPTGATPTGATPAEAASVEAQRADTVRPDAAPERLNLAYLAIIGVAMGVVSIFTGWAWVPAVLTGMVIGRANVEAAKGIRATGGARAARILAVSGGVLAMLLLGAIFGGLIAFLIVALAAFAERVAANTSSIDQTMARVIVGLLTVVVWFGAIYVIGLNLNIRFGG